MGLHNFNTEVTTRLALFCKVAPSAGASSATALFGADAAKQILKGLLGKEVADVTYAEVSSLCAFSWLMTPTEVKSLTDLRNRVISKAGFNSKSVDQAPTGSSASSSSKSKGDARALVKALFKN
jgi:hypothetical protein